MGDFLCSKISIAGGFSLLRMSVGTENDGHSSCSHSDIPLLSDCISKYVYVCVFVFVSVRIGLQDG